MRKIQIHMNDKIFVAREVSSACCCLAFFYFDFKAADFSTAQLTLWNGFFFFACFCFFFSFFSFSVVGLIVAVSVVASQIQTTASVEILAFPEECLLRETHVNPLMLINLKRSFDWRMDDAKRGCKKWKERGLSLLASQCDLLWKFRLTTTEIIQFLFIVPNIFHIFEMVL